VLIDWFTVAAQLLNFVILVALMKRFLYQPVLDAIAAREHKIAAELADAAKTKAQAHQQQAEFQQKNQDFDEQRAALLQKAKAGAKAETQRLQAEAREAADAASAARAEAWLSDAEQQRAQMTRRAQDQVFEVSRRVLTDLASVSLEQQACEVFLQRLRDLDGDALDGLRAALKGASVDEPALLCSAFELPAAQRAALQSAVDQCAGSSVALAFQPAPELVAGLALSAQGQKLAWSISDYLRALSTGLDTLPEAAERA
jgi:F-type H+-transporting ATPase subunit b